MQGMFTIWAKSRDKEQRQRGTKRNKEEQRGTKRNKENGRFAPEKLDEKNSSKYLHIKIIVVPLRYEN